MIGFGFETDPTKTGVSVLPQASMILAGTPGSIASVGQATVDDPFGGATSPPLKLIVYVYVQSVVLLSQAVYR